MVAVLRIFDATPLAINTVNNETCNKEFSTNIHAMPHAPVPHKIETIQKKKKTK